MADDDRIVSAERVVPAPAAEIFDLLADPARHHLFDGSGTVMAGRSNNPERLSLGARFGMDMKILLVPYRMTSEVVEFEEDRRIAWRHIGHHIWRYELDPVTDDPDSTTVTESFDWRSARLPDAFYRTIQAPTKNLEAIVATLERLEGHFSR